MNLGPGTLGGIHTLASLVAILAGFTVVVLPKGSAAHRWRGRLYVGAMLLTNLTALGIYAHGVFGIAHWLTLLNLAVLLAGIGAVRLGRRARRWVQVHAGAMATSWFLLLFAGINEAFLRLSFLTDLAAKFDLPLQEIALFLLLAVALPTLLYLVCVTARRFPRI